MSSFFKQNNKILKLVRLRLNCLSYKSLSKKHKNIATYFLHRYALSLPLVVPPIICAVMMVFMPESPVLLVAKEKFQEAEQALAFYRGQDFDVAGDVTDIQDYLNYNNGNLLHNIKSVATLKSCSILTALFVLVEMAPIATRSIYDDIIFLSGDIYGITKTTCTITFMSMIQVGIIIAAYLIDSVGRKKLLLISTSLTSLTIALLGIYYLVLAFNEISAGSYHYIVVWVLYSYGIGYGIGAAPIVYCLIGELPTSGAKRHTVLVVFSVFWIFTYINMFLYPLAIDKIGEGGVLLITSSFYGVAFIIVLTFFVETKHKTLVEIQMELKNKELNNN